MLEFVPLFLLLAGALVIFGYIFYGQFYWWRQLHPNFTKLPDESLRERLLAAFDSLQEHLDEDVASEVAYLFEDWLAKEDTCLVQYRYYLYDENNCYRWVNFEGYMDKAIEALKSVVKGLDALKVKQAKTLVYRIMAVHRAYFSGYVQQIYH